MRRLLAGEYKWIVFGDDDTVFFPEGIIRALETHHLDADLPYFVSGIAMHPTSQLPIPGTSYACASAGVWLLYM